MSDIQLGLGDEICGMITGVPESSPFSVVSGAVALWLAAATILFSLVGGLGR